MEISALATPPATPVATPAAKLPGPLAYISEQLGMRPEHVRHALGNGASIDDLARSQGVAPDSLRQGLSAFVAQGQSPEEPAEDGRQTPGSAYGQTGAPAAPYRRGAISIIA